MEGKDDKTFHGFSSAEEALNFYYKEVLGGRHIDCCQRPNSSELGL